MKTENTPENKARFFALYWGQKVLKAHSLDNSVFKIFEGKVFKDQYLELTPLSEISDEDAIEVAKLMGGYPGSPYQTLRVAKPDEVGDMVNNRMTVYSLVDGELHEIIDIGDMTIENRRIKFETAVKVADYLRSRGYYIGDGTEIEYGWVKLKTT